MKVMDVPVSKMIVDEFPLMMKVMILLLLMRVIGIIIYFLLILFKFQLNACYYLPTTNNVILVGVFCKHLMLYFKYYE